MKIVFNSSMPRSGSTLLQNILAQNPAIYASPTSGVLDLLYGARANFTEGAEFKAQDAATMQKGFQGFCKAGIEGWYGAITDKSIVVDKSRGWLAYQEWTEQYIEAPKTLVCVRDLCSILASMEKLYRKNMHKADKSDNPAQMAFITANQRVTTWVNGQPVGLAALRILDAIQRGNIKKMCIIRYEDLVSKPDKVLKKIYDYIEEPIFDHDLDAIPQSTKEDDSFYDIYGDHTIRPKLEMAATDAVSLFGEGLCADIVNGNKWYYDYFYSPTANPSKFC